MSIADHSLPWHQSQWQILADARAAGRVPHSLLLSGQRGLGKVAFARRLTQALICAMAQDGGDACYTCHACHLVQTGVHPDVSWIEPEAPGKPIKIDTIRAVTARSVLAAQGQGFRVIVVVGAEAMNRAAANALLKTLEEPTSRTVLILISSHIDRVIPTIRSRCQLVNFRVPDNRQAHDWLSTQGKNDDIDDLLAIAGGAPLVALQAGEESWRAHDKALADDLQVLRQRKENPLAIVEKWQQRPIRDTIDGLKRCLCDLIRVAAGARSSLYHPSLVDELLELGGKLPPVSAFQMYDAVLAAEQGLANNANEQMTLESVAVRWLELTRSRG